MKLTLVAALISVVAFIGCAPENRNNNSDPVPEEINFSPLPGKTMSPQDYSDLKEYFKNNKFETPAKFLVDTTHGAELAKQSPQYQGAILDLKRTCTVTPSTKSTSGNSTDVSSYVNGSNCAIDYSSIVHTDMDTSKFDQQKGGVITANLSGNENETVKTASLQSLAHFVSSKLSFAGNMAIEAVPEKVKMIFNLRYGGTINMQDRTLGLAGGASILLNNSRVHVVAHLKIQGLPTDLSISAEGRGMATSSTNANMVDLRFAIYINGTRLDVPTLNDLSKSIDPDGTNFRVNGDDTVTFLGSSTLQNMKIGN